MKTQLHHIAITNFKAFRDFSLQLEGRHLLVYGANGAGKSSLYWALYTFLQSARKPKNGVAKYFDAADAQNLLNLHEQKEPAPRAGEIALTLRDTATSHDTTYRIRQADHDMGFFREFKRCIGNHHADWCCVRLQGNAAQSIQARNEKNDMQRAEAYLNNHDIEEAAMFLRKAAESTARRFREWAEGKSLPPGDFFSLTENLRAARNKMRESLPARLYERVLDGVPEKLRELLVALDDTDIDQHPSLQPAEKGVLRDKRRALRQVLSDGGWAKMEAIQTLDRVLEMTERVLNPAAHGNEAPLYDEEVRRAKTLIDRLERFLLEAQP